MIQVRVDKAQAVAALQRLKVKRRLTQAIRLAIRDGKGGLTEEVIRRYTARNPLSLGKVSTYARGLSGTLKVTGKRNPLKKFKINPARRLNPQPAGGVHATVVKGQGGDLSRAFIWQGHVFERKGRPRLPIRKIQTISLAGMAKAVGEKVERKMARALDKRLMEALS